MQTDIKLLISKAMRGRIRLDHGMRMGIERVRKGQRSYAPLLRLKWLLMPPPGVCAAQAEKQSGRFCLTRPVRLKQPISMSRLQEAFRTYSHIHVRSDAPCGSSLSGFSHQEAWCLSVRRLVSDRRASALTRTRKMRFTHLSRPRECACAPV